MFCCGETLLHKANWKGEALFYSHFNITVHHQKQSGQDVKQGRQLEAGLMQRLGRKLLLDLMVMVAQPAFL